MAVTITSAANPIVHALLVNYRAHGLPDDIRAKVQTIDFHIGNVSERMLADAENGDLFLQEEILIEYMKVRGDA